MTLDSLAFTHQQPRPAQPFDTAEQAWFWFTESQTQPSSARFKVSTEAGFISRPCQPIDILQALDGLYRSRRLTMDHLLVLRHYGRRMLPPDPRRAKEIRGYRIWTEALTRLGEILEDKKIIKPQGLFALWMIDPHLSSTDLYREAAK